MKKAFNQGLILVVLFFSTWFVLKQVDWVTLFKVKKVTNKTEEKLGELFWHIYQNSEKENTDLYINTSIDSIINKICINNRIDRRKIKLHILEMDEVNAFALPNGHLLIYSGLIKASYNQEELSGVICHEIAHIENKHVMQKLVKEVGLSVLISMATGNEGSSMIKGAARLLSSTAFDRRLEKEADIIAVDYLINAKINPEPFAEFLYKLSLTDPNNLEYFSWVRTHPDAKKRAEYIIEYSLDKLSNPELVISKRTWQNILAKFNN